MAYHKAHIEKGHLGFSSKIQEELDELKDAEQQQARILMLCEVADLIGAIEAYMKAKFSGFTLEDAIGMARLTQSEFEEGKR